MHPRYGAPLEPQAEQAYARLSTVSLEIDRRSTRPVTHPCHWQSDTVVSMVALLAIDRPAEKGPRELDMATVGDIYEVALWSHMGVQAGIMVRHYRVLAVRGAGVTDAAIAALVSSEFAAKVKALLCTSATFEGATVQKISPAPVGSRTADLGDAGAGTGGATIMPPQVAGLITHRTSLAGKSKRGRSYIPFPAEEDSDAGNPTAAYVVKLDTLASEFQQLLLVGTGGNEADLKPVVWSRKLSTATDITLSIARTVWATQRRRGSFGAPNANLAE